MITPDQDGKQIFRFPHGVVLLRQNDVVRVIIPKTSTDDCSFEISLIHKLILIAQNIRNNYG